MVDNIYFKLSDGEKAVLKRGISPAVGDTLLIHADENENFITHGKSSISVGDEVIVFLDENNQYCGVKSGEGFDSCVFITRGFKRQASPIGEIINIGTFSFNWDGEGQVYVLDSCVGDLSKKVYADDALTASTSKAAVTMDYGGMWSKDPLNITSILNNGSNIITITLTDVYGGKIGCLSLYIVSIPD